MAVIDDPAAAIAAARCLTARTIARREGEQWTTQHPRTCSWCDLPVGYLAKLVEGWVEWTGVQERHGAVVYARVDAQRFAEQARRNPSEVERLITEAQGLEPVDPPPVGDQAAEEELAAWT